MPSVDFDLWLLVVQPTFQILQCGIFFFKVHFISLQECSFTPPQKYRHGTNLLLKAQLKTISGRVPSNFRILLPI